MRNLGEPRSSDWQSSAKKLKQLSIQRVLRRSESQLVLHSTWEEWRYRCKSKRNSRTPDGKAEIHSRRE